MAKKCLLVVEDNARIAEMIRVGLAGQEYELIFADEGHQAVELANSAHPDLILLDIVVPGMSGHEICKKIKESPVTSYIPVLMLSGDKTSTEDKVQGLESGGDDYLIKPFDIEELKARIRALLRRSESFLDANPLTKLPGGNRIHQEIEAKISSDLKFAVAYCDLSNFKAFNDVYGYERGNKVIHFSASVILKALHANDPAAFLGHVGGDDFIFICSASSLERVASEVMQEFDSGIMQHYDIEDLKKGGIRTENRQGHLERFRVMTIAVVAATNRKRNFESALEVSEILTELKRHAKQSNGSIFLIDKRS